MQLGPSELSQILLSLLDAEVAFVLVGGGAALIHGAPTTTQDVDIVPSRSPENVQRLLTVLGALDAHHLDLEGRTLRPTEESLRVTGQALLRTSLGRIDVLGTLHDGRDYDDLMPSAVVLDFRGRSLRVIDLPTLIEVKRSTGRAKDRLILPVLLELARRQTDEDDQ